MSPPALSLVLRFTLHGLRASMLLLLGPVFANGASALPESSTLKQLSFEELGQIEVTSASRRSEKLAKAASAIQVVTGGDIRRSTATSIPEALRLADNLDVAQRNARDWAITARGFNTDLANKLLVMMDGRTIYTPLFSGVIWNAQDYLLEDIDRIEVISGPGGTLWGANAVNGVINIMSRSAKDTQGVYGEVGGGNEDRGFAALRYGAEMMPGVFFRIYGKHAEVDGTLRQDGRSASDSSKRTQGGFRLDAEVSPEHALTVQGDIYAVTNHNGVGGRDRLGGGNLLGRWSRFFADGSDLHLQVYFDRAKLSQFVRALRTNTTILAPEGRFDDRLDTYDVDFQHSFTPTARQQVVWGLGYRITHDVVTNAPALAFFPERLNQERLTAFAEDRIALGPNLAATLGAKIEHNEYTGVEVEPSLRVQWNASHDHNFWASVARAVRTPSRIDRDLSQGAPPHFVLLAGSPDFVSETVEAYGLGHRGEFGRLRTSLTLFYNEYDDIRSTELGPPSRPFPLIFQNNLQGETHGIEFTADWEPLANWRLHAGYTFLWENLRIKASATDINNALNETSDPPQRVSLRSSWDLPRRLELDFHFRWVDRRPVHLGATAGELPSYAEIDVRLAWQANERLELSLSGQNLLHDHHVEYGFPDVTREQIPRSIHFKAVWRY